MAWMFPKPTVNMARGIVSSRMAPRLNVGATKVSEERLKVIVLMSTRPTAKAITKPRIRALRIGGKRLDITE